MIVTESERTAWFQSAQGATLSSAHNTFLNTLQPWVEKACWRVIGYSPEQATYTEFYPSSGSERPPLNFGIDIGWDLIGSVAMPRSRTDLYEGALTLRVLPVRSVASVYENLAAWTGGDLNGNFPSTSLLPASAYRLDMESPGLCKSGRLYRSVGGWPSSPRTVKITYTAGYTQGEIDSDMTDLKMAVLQGLSWWWKRARLSSAGVNSNGLAALSLAIRDFSVTFGDPNEISAQKGSWAFQILGPDSMNILITHANLSMYLLN